MKCSSNLSRRLKRRRQVGGRLSCNGRGERGRLAGGRQVRVHTAVYRLPARATLQSVVNDARLSDGAPNINPKLKYSFIFAFLSHLLNCRVVSESSIAVMVQSEHLKTGNRASDIALSEATLLIRCTKRFSLLCALGESRVSAHRMWLSRYR